MGAKGRPRARCCWGWDLAILIFVLINTGFLIATWVAVKFIRADELPHCYRVFGTGPDVIPGPGEADPFFPVFGAMIKGFVEVGDCCIKWDIQCFNFTDVPTEMHIHGMLFKNETTAPIFIDMGVEGFTGTSGHSIRNKCLEITYEQEFAITSRPEAFYLDIHSEAFPDGAVRSPLGTRCGGAI